MALFLQLRLLLWKNCVYRRRQKFRFAVELMWPLCLFLLLMWVRTKGFHKTMHQCHFEEKPLPSSGQLLFFQGALCAFNNTCHEYLTQANRDQSSKTSSKFNEILEDAKAYAETMVDGNKTKLDNFAINIGQLAEELSKIHLKDGDETYLDQNLTKYSIGRIVKLHHKLDQSIQEIKPVVKLIGLLDKIYNNYDNLTELIKEAPFLDEFFIRLHTYVCGNNSKITLDMLLDTKNEYYGFDYFLDINKFPTTLHYEYDEESSELCNELYEKLETTPSLKIVWRIMKPFVKGKIVYSPNTTVIRRIVDRVRTLMTPLSLPNFDAERESLSMDPIVYLHVVKNIKLIKDYLQTMKKLKNSENIDYLLQHEFHESVFKAEEIIERYNEKYRNIGKSNITLLEILQCYNQRDFEGYSTEREAEERSMALCDKNDLLAQINFENGNENNLSPLVSYKIRLNSERMPHPTDLGKFSLNSGPGYRPMNDLKLITFGFIYIQDLFEKSIISEITGREITPGIVLKQFPHPCYIEDWFMSSLSDMFPLFMVLSWVYTSSMIVKSIVHEKEQKLKETMCVLGLNNKIYWCSWFIDSFIPMSVTVCLLSVILVYGGILANADLTLVMVFLILFAVATINQSFLLSVCFSKANQAASSSGVIYFITYLPFPFIEQWYPHFAPVTKLFACSLSNVALGLGSRYFSMRESEGAGCKWRNVAESPVPGDKFNLLLIMFILVFDSTIYLFLAWYVENVFPGSYGMPKPWNFPFKKSYWCNPPVDLLEEESDSGNTSLDEKLKKDRLKYHFESIPEQLRIGVSISNLSKTYKNNVTAISNLNINFYEDQITAFLGRNGAGKTTTISILTGLFPPTSGTAKIYGQDVRTSITSIRQNLGICPQYNLYFNCFTVEEHLWFFARLKGHSPGEAQVEIQQILQDLGLSNKKQCLASYLSGGMKRKLSVAIAFIGGSRTVILDEPTAGVDPYSRIGIWDLIQKNKKGRTIILTTHMMSEAELLGDRIAIFANGDLLCCGSSSFLKSNFGWGIVLTVDFSRMNNKEDEAKVKELTEAINSIIPSSNVIDIFGTEIKFNLPKVDGNVENYNKLFSYLEENRSYLGINTYGIADTSLEEIFMKMVGEHDKKDGNFNAKDQVNELKLTNFGRFEKEKPKNRYLRQFTALLHKRLHHFKRSKLILGVELILPIVFVCVCMLVTSKLPNVQHPRAYVVDISNCTNCTSFFEIIPETSSEWIERYVQFLTDPIGIGIKCIGDNITRQSSCSDISLKKDNVTLLKKIYSDCTCEAGSISCSKNATYGTLPFFVLGSGHEMINVTDINVTKWILNSWKQFGSIRTGGYSFGLKLPTKGMSLSTIFDDIKKEKQKNMDIIKDYYDFSLNDNIVIWYNNKWSLSPVVYLNGINNVILRASVPEDESHKFGISLTVHAMNYTPAQFQSEIMLTGAAALLHSVSLIFSLSFIPTAFILYLIEERITNSKHLQFLSGVNWMVYWIQAFIWDMICYFIAILFCIIGLMIFGTEMYVNKTSFPCLCILILLYGWANIPFMYPASFFFQVSSSAFVTLSCVNLLIGLTTTATTYVLRILKDEYLSAIEITLRKVLLIFPHFCFGDGVMKLAEMYLLTTSLSKYNVKLNFNLYSWDYLGKNYACMFLEGFIFFVFTLFYEKYNRQGLCPKHLVSLNPPEILDDDVKQERQRILKSPAEDILVLKCLTKVYKPRNFIAVNQICLGVNSGQCFGLLGLNGAGKTTTFMMLTGATNISFGDARIKGVSIRKDMCSLRSCIGYCPQTDALDPKLTPKEHLEMYARLRNIPIDKIKLVVTNALTTYDLARYKNICTKYLSGGNKRKLSTAIAILGYPDVVYLDEPTSGMDPKGRRFLWNRIREIVASGHAVILTTHNMHECEVLCSRVTIMAHGQLMCLGTIQHIKNKFGQGYNLVVWSSFDNIPKIEKLFIEILPEAVLKSSHHTQIKYYLPIETFCLSKVLRHLENLKKDKLAYDYSLSQKTLDEIFLHFVTKHTIEEECIDYHNCICFQELCCRRRENINSRVESEKFVMKA